MNFQTDDDLFRKEVRHFLKNNLPCSISKKVTLGITPTKADTEYWHSILNSRGWLAPQWPVKYGGTGWGKIKQYIFEEELALADAPRPLPFAYSMLAPVLIKFGTEAQKSYWLPRMLEGKDWWCQGYSEPNSGSDLASLNTTAVRIGEEYIINGQKAWTSHGQHANMIFCLVRTSKKGRPQEGISFVLIDMKSPGVEVRPIRLIDGGYEVNEVWFSDVRIPLSNRISEENEGWRCAKYLLSYERANIADTGGLKRKLVRLKNLFKKVCEKGQSPHRNELLSARIARLEIGLNNFDITCLRILKDTGDKQIDNSKSSMLKILSSEFEQELDLLRKKIAGRLSLPFIAGSLEDDKLEKSIVPEEILTASSVYFNNRKVTIYGGSNEIQKNIIVKTAMDL